MLQSNENILPEEKKGALAHSLQGRHVTMIALGGIIGAGLLVGGSSTIALAGPAVVLAYLGGGALVFILARMLGEMAANNPQQGSFAAYTSAALGPWAGFTSRWLYWLFWIFAVGAEAVIAARLIQEIGIPGPLWLISAVLLGLLTVVNLFSVRIYGELELWLATLKVVAIAGFIATGVVFLAGFNDGVTNPVDNIFGHGGFFPNGFTGILATFPIVMFSMIGSEVATIAAAESKDPVRNIIRAGRTVTLRIIIFYLLSISVILLLVPWTQIVPGTSPFIPALNVIGIPYVQQAMLIVTLTAVLSVLNSGLYITSRMLFELAAEGDAPRLFAVTKYNVPVFSVPVGLAVGMLAIVAQLFLSEDVFTLLAKTSGNVVIFIYGLIALAQIRSRRKLEAEGRKPLVAVWLFPWLSYIFIAAIISLFVQLCFIPSERTPVLLSLVPIAFVLLVAFLRKRKA